MKHVFKQLQINQPKTKVGEGYKPCQFKTTTVIIDLEHISAIVECGSFRENKLCCEVEDWLEEHKVIATKIVLKDGTCFSNIIAPNMEYFGVILGDVTF